MLASQLYGLYMPTCQKLTIISPDFNSSRLFNAGADGLPDLTGDQTCFHQQLVCRRSLLFIALVLANISFQGLFATEAGRQNNSNEYRSIVQREERRHW